MKYSFVAATFVALSILAATAQADYYRITYPSAALSSSQRTHFVVSGVGGSLSTMPQIAAATKIKKLAETYPGDQIVYIAAKENEGNAESLGGLGFKNIKLVARNLTADRVMSEAATFNAIASFHYYGHSAISKGLFLDTGDGTEEVRWLPTDPAAALLSGKFTQDAFVTLNGCNGGHILAPLLSKLWSVPVAGAMTGTAFESLHDDGKFYRNTRETKPSRADKSMGIFHREARCSSGACLRMRPDNQAYNGHYGKYAQGLGFYKFFCVGISEEKCLTGMARSIFSMVSDRALSLNPSQDEFAETVREWLCPAGKYQSDLQANCMRQLEAVSNSPTSSERRYTPFRSASAQCTFATCYANPVCSRPASTPECAKSESAPASSTTFVDEYLNYLKGFALLP